MSNLRRRDSVLEALERIRKTHPDVGLTHVIGFLYVCENEGLNVAELAEVMQVTRATASRTARALASPDHPDTLPPSLGLVDIQPNPYDGRGKVLSLSSGGEALRDALDLIIASASPIKVDVRKAS